MKEKHKSLIIITFLFVLSVAVIVISMPKIIEYIAPEVEEEVDIDLNVNFNDGNTVFDKEIIMQPSESIIESVFIRNDGNVDLYYRIYLENIVGLLGEVTTITIYDENMTVLSTKNVLELTLNESYISSEILAVGESVTLYIELSISEEADNTYQNTKMEVDIIVNAIVAE